MNLAGPAAPLALLRTVYRYLVVTQGALTTESPQTMVGWNALGAACRAGIGFRATVPPDQSRASMIFRETRADPGLHCPSVGS
jgi:hypothetical protein